MDITEKLDEFIAYISIGDESSPSKDELIDLLEDSRNEIEDQQALIKELGTHLSEARDSLCQLSGQGYIAALIEDIDHVRAKAARLNKQEG